MKHDVNQSSPACLQCQIVKGHRHTKAPPAKFSKPEARFHLVRLDLLKPRPPLTAASTHSPAWTTSPTGRRSYHFPISRQKRPQRPSWPADLTYWVASLYWPPTVAYISTDLFQICFNPWAVNRFEQLLANHRLTVCGRVSLATTGRSASRGQLPLERNFTAGFQAFETLPMKNCTPHRMNLWLVTRFASTKS